MKNLEQQLQEVDFGQEKPGERELETYLYWLRNAYSWQQTVANVEKEVEEDSCMILDEIKTEYYH